ncbi:MAG: hypothetical protein ACI4PF_02655, partial [Christensenellales bacterium]
NGQTINIFTSHNHNYTFLGCKSGSSEFRTDTQYLSSSTDEIQYYAIDSITVTRSYYGNSGENKFEAYYTPSIHEVNVIVDNGTLINRGLTNGTVTVPNKVESNTPSDDTTTGTNVTSLVKHSNDLTITLNPDDKFILHKINVKYYDYLYNEEVVRQYMINESGNISYGDSKPNYNTLPLMNIYSDGTVVTTTLTINQFESNVMSGGTATGDINYYFNIAIDNLYGNLEIHLDFVRYYWNDTPYTTTLSRDGADGSMQNPYKITKASDWGYIVDNAEANNYYAGKYFILTNDIDFNARFTPTLNKFSGYIYGNGYTMKNILLDSYLQLGSSYRTNYMNEVKTGVGNVDSTNNITYFGLIGILDGQITNINFENLTLIASENNVLTISNSSVVGGVVASAQDDALIKGIVVDNNSSITIEGNSNLSASVTKFTSTLGGIIGHLTDYTVISNSINNGNIIYKLDNSSAKQTISNVGCIAGLIDEGSVAINNKNTGNISYNANGTTQSGTKYASGIANMSGENCIIYNASNLGNISATISAGISANTTGIIVNAYSSGTITGSNTSAGLIYKIDTNAIVRNMYSVCTANSIDYNSKNSNSIVENIYYLSSKGSGKGTQLSDAQMRDKNNFSGFNFSGDWVMPTSGSYNYPILRFETIQGYETLGINDYSSSTTAKDTGLWIDSPAVASINLNDLYNASLDAYIIDSAEELAYLSRISTYDNSAILNGKTFVIASEDVIDMSGKYWTPINSINSENNKFNIIGVKKNANDLTSADLDLDANVDNVVIKGLSILSVFTSSAFVSRLDDGVIKGIDLVDVSNIGYNSEVSSFVSYMYGGSIIKCNYVSGNVVGFDIDCWTPISGLVAIADSSSRVYGSSVTGYNSDGELHNTYDLGSDLG